MTPSFSWLQKLVGAKWWHVIVLVLVAVGGIVAALVTGRSTTVVPSSKPAVVIPRAVVRAKVAPEAIKAPAVVVNQHVCSSKDSTMGCVLALPQNATPPAPNALAEIRSAGQAATTFIQGIDFAWSCPLSQAKNFGASYVSYDTSKDWTRSCVDAFHKAGKATVAVWEAGANDTQQGYGTGQSQTRQAIVELNALGAGPQQPVILAIDCDCSGSSLVGYFQGANSVNGSHPIEAYGGYYQLQYLYAKHLIGHANWQTYAWSSGHWLPASVAPLEQYLNSSSVDYDRAIAPYYGQWPYKGKSPNPPQPSGPRCFGAGYAHTSFCSKVRSQDAALGQLIAKEKGYLKVSVANRTKLQHELAVVQARINTEAGKVTAATKALEASLHRYGCHAKSGKCA